MADWPLLGEAQKFNAVGNNLSASRGTSVSTPATAHTKGSWVQLVASTPLGCEGVFVSITSLNATDGFVTYLVDIGIGSAGSEVVVIPNLIAQRGGKNVIYYFPLSIPAGVRLSARAQCNEASGSLTVSATLVGQGFLPSQPLSKVESYGVNLSTTRGTQIDPGGTANTKGAYSEIVASLPDDLKMAVFGFGNAEDFARGSGDFTMDVAVGASGSEIIVIPDFVFAFQGSSDTVDPVNTSVFPFSVRAGERIAARAQSDSIDAGDRLFDLIIYGML